MNCRRGAWSCVRDYTALTLNLTLTQTLTHNFDIAYVCWRFSHSRVCVCVCVSMSVSDCGKGRLLDLFVTWLVIIDSRIQCGLVAAAWQLADAASFAGIDALSDCHVRPHE